MPQALLACCACGSAAAEELQVLAGGETRQQANGVGGGAGQQLCQWDWAVAAYRLAESISTFYQRMQPKQRVSSDYETVKSVATRK